MKPVEVLSADRWHPGALERWKRGARGWVGYVWWREDAGLQHVEWISADRQAERPLAT